jgi:hypothetical protein
VARKALSEIIDVLNERFGTNFTKADQLFFDQVMGEAKDDNDVAQRAARDGYNPHPRVWLWASRCPGTSRGSAVAV